MSVCIATVHCAANSRVSWSAAGHWRPEAGDLETGQSRPRGHRASQHQPTTAQQQQSHAATLPPTLLHPVLPSLGSSNLDNSPACLECHYKHDQKYPTSQTFWLLLLLLCTHKHTIIPELHHNPQLHQCRYVSRAAIVLYRASRGGFALVSSLLNTNKTILN